ncbi:response regulator [Roseovarius rhodophyticola]|uniref:Response regulator n=1 Tax=Roseovarius rhodophyticola TaxID=3080827 RepID=A0ABZ2TG88_9RHOB|nr:response regulator [Roseovarius sp. W115]MDV2928903.1 response regulator [Roseovarius sp. W115]
MSITEKLTVMVVDDMSVSRGLIIMALEAMGIKNIDYCTDGESAFKRLAAKPVHLVISDYNMPGADGLQLLEGLRRFKPTQRIGFILVTGTADPGVIDRGLKLGMNNYIKKPFSPEALKACIERVVGRI